MIGFLKIFFLGLEKKIEIEFDMFLKLFFVEICGFVLRVLVFYKNFEIFYKKMLEVCEYNLGFGSI